MRKKMEIPVDQIISCYKKGMSVQELEWELGISGTKIRNVLKENGIPRQNYRIIDTLNFEEIKELIKKKTSNEIGALYGVSGKTILNFCQKYGIEVSRRKQA